MKKLILSTILAALVALGTTAKAQEHPDEYLGLPGDNLNLYAVMKLFQESETLEGFERNLNAQDSKINNLDLNNDNLVDYITVTDYPDGDDHTIVLRVPLGRKDFQDVAVFTVQKFRNGSVQIQLIGDESLYGKNYIIEPNYAETPNPGYRGRYAETTNTTIIYTDPYQIATWPLIRYIYMPNYIGWHSAWYWGFYPDYWTPWRPFYWDFYYGYHYNWYPEYYSYYRHWNYCRWGGYNDFYYHGVRAYSPLVVVNINRNVYRNTYSHPEQRKEGEALYSRTNPGRGSRSMESRESGNSYRQPANASRQPQGTSREATRSSVQQRTATDNRSAQSARTPQSRSTESARAPQSRSTQSARAPQSRSTESARAPQSRSTQTARAPQSRSTESARAPQSSRSTQSANAPQNSRSNQSARASQGSRSTQSAKAPQSSRSTQSARAPQSSSNRSSRASSSSGQRSSAGRSSSSSGRSSSSSSSSSSRSSSGDSRSRSR